MALETFARQSLAQFIIIYGEIFDENAIKPSDLEHLMWGRMCAKEANINKLGFKVPYDNIRRSKVTLPYLPDDINYTGCNAIKKNGGLYTPCCGKIAEGAFYCKTCSFDKEGEVKELEFGDADSRNGNVENERFAPITFGEWMKGHKMTLSEVYAKLAAAGVSIEIPPEQLMCRELPKRRKGRPAKSEDSVVDEDTVKPKRKAKKGSDSEEEPKTKAKKASPAASESETEKPKKKATKKAPEPEPESESEEEAPPKKASKASPKPSPKASPAASESETEKPKKASPKPSPKASPAASESDTEKPKKKATKKAPEPEPESEEAPPKKKASPKASPAASESETEKPKKATKKAPEPEPEAPKAKAKKVEKEPKAAKEPKAKAEKPKAKAEKPKAKAEKTKAKAESDSEDEMPSRPTKAFKATVPEIDLEELAAGFEEDEENEDVEATIDEVDYIIRNGKFVCSIDSGEILGTVDGDEVVWNSEKR